MRRFTFRLERILRLKRQRERQAELRQAQAFAHAESARRQLENIHNHLNVAAADASLRAATPRSATARIAELRYLTQLQSRVELAGAAVRKAEQLLEQASAERAKIHREVESLLVVRRDQWNAHRVAAGRAAQLRLDELSLRRWQINHAGELVSIHETEVGKP